MVIEAEKSPDLPNKNWRPQTASGMIQPKAEVLGWQGFVQRWMVSEPKDPRIRSSDVWGQKKMDIPDQEEMGSLFHLFVLLEPSVGSIFHLFVLLEPSVDEMMPSQLGRAYLLYLQAADSNVNLFLKHPHRHSEIVFYELPGHSSAQASWHAKLTTTLGNKNVYTACILDISRFS